MQMIWNDLAAGNITVSTEDASFPLENMSDNNPSHVWKATGPTATITVTLASAGAYPWALYNTSDLIIQYRVKNGAATVASGSLQSDFFNNFWLDVAYTLTSTSIEFDITSGSAPPASVGILRGGSYVKSNDPIDLSREFKDFSEMRLTRNQAYDFYQKNRVWMFSGTTQSPITISGSQVTPGLSQYLYYYQTKAPYPMAFKVLETTYAHYVFGIPTFRDSGQIFYEHALLPLQPQRELINTSFSIEEVV